MSRRKTVVFIETNFSGLDAFLYCREQGYRAVLISDSLERFKAWFPKSVLYKIDAVDQLIQVIDSSDLAELRKVISEQVGDVDAVLTFAEIRTRVVAELARELGLRGASPQAVSLAQDKDAFRTRLAERGLEEVFHRRIERVTELKELGNELRFPCFIKPCSGHSSIGAVICPSADAADAIIMQLEKVVSEGISTAFVVEELLEGPLVSVEALTIAPGVHEVLGIADRDVLGASIEVGSSFPFVGPERAKIIAHAKAALDAIGYDFGPSHIEIILTADGPRLVEVNTRVGGSGHSVMLDAALGRSVTGDCVELCLGALNARTYEGDLYQSQQGAAWQCLASERPGTISAMPVLRDVLAQPGIIATWYHHDEGDELGELDSNFNWILQVMCVGRDAAEAKARALAATKFAARQTYINGQIL